MIVKSKPRFTIEVTEAQQRVFQKYVPHGLKKVIIGQMIEDCCFMLETYGANYIAAVLSREVDFRSNYTHGTNRESAGSIN